MKLFYYQTVFLPSLSFFLPAMIFLHSRSEVLQDKLAKLNADKEKCSQKLDSITKQIEELQEELNAQRIDEVLSVIQEQGLLIDQEIERLRG